MTSPSVDERATQLYAEHRDRVMTATDRTFAARLPGAQWFGVMVFAMVLTDTGGNRVVRYAGPTP